MEMRAYPSDYLNSAQRILGRHVGFRCKYVQYRD